MESVRLQTLEYAVMQTARGSPMLGRTLQPPLFSLEMEATCLSETWLHFYYTASHYIQEVCHFFLSVLCHRQVTHNK
jgi:hypothetical protein